VPSAPRGTDALSIILKNRKSRIHFASGAIGAQNSTEFEIIAVIKRGNKPRNLKNPYLKIISSPRFSQEFLLMMILIKSFDFHTKMICPVQVYGGGLSAVPKQFVKRTSEFFFWASKQRYIEKT
jgi:hypothetical protein